MKTVYTIPVTSSPEHGEDDLKPALIWSAGLRPHLGGKKDGEHCATNEGGGDEAKTDAIK